MSYVTVVCYTKILYKSLNILMYTLKENSTYQTLAKILSVNLHTVPHLQSRWCTSISKLLAIECWIHVPVYMCDCLYDCTSPSMCVSTYMCLHVCVCYYVLPDSSVCLLGLFIRGTPACEDGR